MAAAVVARRYRLEDRLSTTAFSDVWIATDSVLGRRVVVKLLAPDADRPRFEREARAAAALAHPNVAQVFDYGEHQGRPYMVLEYLPGGTLAERLREGQPITDAEARRIATDVAAGLAHAHAHGVVHRDLKPGNVLFDAEDRAKVGDFGIAHVQGADTLTEAGTVIGTAAFMAPEQVVGDPATPATDVYAFGVLLYRMVTGRLPFESENALELARMQRDAEPPPIRFVRPDAPGDLAALATAALSKDPALRPQGGAALLRSLQSRPTAATVVAGSVTRRLPAVAESATRRLPAVAPRRRRLVYALAGMLLIAAGLVVAVVVVGSHSSAPGMSTHATTRRHRTHSATTATPPPPTTLASTTSTTVPRSTRTPPPPPPPTTATSAPLPTTIIPSTTLPTTVITTTLP